PPHCVPPKNLVVTPPWCSHRLQDLERDEETLSEKESVREKLSLIHGFLQVEAQQQLSELEAKLRCQEMSEVSPAFPQLLSTIQGGYPSFFHPPQERYLAQVKALLHQELSVGNRAAVANGCPRYGTYGSEDEDGAADMEEGIASSSSSSLSLLGPAPRARKARRSRSNGESKSKMGGGSFPTV
ncbi:DNMT1 methyltransferase, partial [Tachuris rubrigastra]|nr:DNMT1 methyltransferase [Tachuris rubrigastra]